MTTIAIQQVTGSGFLTFYNAFDFHIANYEGKTLQIDGWNKDDEMSKSNGSGKSSLLEVISWGLYGEINRKNRYKDEVIYNRNGVTRDQATVLIDFKVGYTLYRSERTIQRKKSPELTLWMEDEELLKGSSYVTKQKYLESILGMNFIAFQCCAMFGRDFMNFPDLKPSERAEVLTDIRGLDDYVVASKTATDNTKHLFDIIAEITNELKTLEGRVTQLQSTNYKKQIEGFETEKKLKLEKLQLSKESIEAQLNEFKNKKDKEVQKLKIQIESIKQLIAHDTILLVKLPTFEDERRRIEQEGTKLSTNEQFVRAQKIKKLGEIVKIQKLRVGKCPTCNQPITGEHVRKEIVAYKSEVTQLIDQLDHIALAIKDYDKQLHNVVTNIKSLSTIQNIVSNRKDTIQTAEVEIINWEKSILEQQINSTLIRVESDIKATKSLVNPYIEQEVLRKSNLLLFSGEVKNKKKEINDVKDEIQYYQFWIDGFKKIRMSLFNTMIYKFQEFTQEFFNQYSSELQIKFSTERETRSGTIKDEFNISITDYNETKLSYEMYSGGEKQKIRLSIAMALAEMIRDDCGKEFNFLAFDEPNDALDEVGREVNFEIFTKLADGGKAVLVTDHDSSFKDKFNESITVVKEDNKSFITI